MTKPDSLRYPIGKFHMPEVITDGIFSDWLSQLETLPLRVERLVRSLSEAELQMQYRQNSWNIRQLVHHLADSHLNAYMRIKLALTEDEPAIKPYQQEGWANTPDNELPLDIPLNLLKAVHAKMSFILRSLSEEELARTYYHPDNDNYPTIKEVAGLYAWHGEHHLGHIKMALGR